MKNGMRPIHPGEILREEYLNPLNMSANALAHAIGVPANRVSSIVAGVRGITADTALRLAMVFGTSPEFWLNMQQSYDLRLAAKSAKIASKKIVPLSNPHRRASGRETHRFAAKAKGSPKRAPARRSGRTRTKVA
jgi:addiction module HigA family antidote